MRAAEGARRGRQGRHHTSPGQVIRDRNILTSSTFLCSGEARAGHIWAGAGPGPGQVTLTSDIRIIIEKENSYYFAKI